jgi:hypothetical protein
MKMKAACGLICPLGSGRDRVRATLARPAHGDRAQRKQQEEPRIGVGLFEAARRQRDRPEAGEGKQEKPDRPVDAGEPEIRQDRGGREAVDKIPGAGVGNRGRFALGRGTCHVFGPEPFIQLPKRHVHQAPAPLRQIEARHSRRDRA